MSLVARHNSGELTLLSVRKGSAVYHALKRAILLRDIAPGEALIEQTIARHMGCSQGPVREALMRLNEDGLVERRGYKGTIVSEVSVEEVAQMARIRIDLEVMGARRAAHRFATGDGDRLRGVLADMEEALDDGDGYRLSELDRLFHLLVFRLSGLKSLEPILERCALYMHRFTFGNPDDEALLERPAEAHDAILTGLEAGDASAAAFACADHIKRVIVRWSPALDSALESLEQQRLPASMVEPPKPRT